MNRVPLPNPFPNGVRVVLLSKLQSGDQFIPGDVGTVVGVVKLPPGMINASGQVVKEIPEVKWDRTGISIGVYPGILAYVH